MLTPRTLALVLCLLFCVSPALAQEGQTAGIPVTDEVTRADCGGCHIPDEEGRMSRISYIRKTPEGWQQTIKRMVREQDVDLDPVRARAIVKYLSNDHGLAPDEARPAFYEAERRMIRETIPDPSLADTCIACHSLGRVLSQRRDRDEWQLLINFHLALYPVTEFQGFRVIRNPSSRVLPAVGEARTNDEPNRPGPIPAPLGEPVPGLGGGRDPVDMAIDYLGNAQPLDTPEWRAWRATARSPSLEGEWAVEAYMPGKGRGYGQMTISPGAVEDEFQTETVIDFTDGTRTSRDGRVILYAGYSWRGSSTDPGAEDQHLGQLREAMMLSSDDETLEGRWFSGAYDEIGIDVRMTHVQEDIHVSGTDISALAAGSTGTLRVYGANFPSDLNPQDIDFGSGIDITSVEANPEVVTVQVAVDAEAMPGYRDAVVRGRVAPSVLAVFDRVDYIRVLPEQGMARLGGGAMPKQFQQFDAVAYHNGPDGVAGSRDDFELGPVPVAWSVEEYQARLNDDDVDYVGTLDDNGFFTPNIEGPNPERPGSTNNFGDVRIIATYEGTGARRPIRGGAHLVVTVPLYSIWQQFEVLP